MRRRECLANRVHLRVGAFLNSELAIHFPGREGLDLPLVFLFPRLEVCLECGFAEFAIPERELQVLRQRTPTGKVVQDFPATKVTGIH
jgi:hypothetical protein